MLARAYAVAAVQADKEGRYDEAIKNYRRAIEVLHKILALYPNVSLAKTYARMISQYEARIKQLERIRLPASGGDGSGEEDEWIVTTKPKVTFADIADLEEAKRVTREDSG